VQGCGVQVRGALERRVERAAQLLAETSRDVSEIAADVGFASGSSLARVFRSVHDLDLSDQTIYKDRIDRGLQPGLSTAERREPSDRPEDPAGPIRVVLPCAAGAAPTERQI